MHALSDVARRLSLLAGLTAAAGCATTTTALPAVDPEAIVREERLQREAVLRATLAQQHRLDSLALPLLRAAVPLCGEDAIPWHGFRALEAAVFPEPWQDAARTTYGLGDTLRVFSTTPGGPADRAGIRAGDVLVRVGDHPVTPGEGAAVRLARALARQLPSLDTLHVAVRRDGRALDIPVPLETVCAYETVVVPDMELNAFADGGAVYVTTAMMRFAGDEEIAAVLAHEIAHNGMGHLDAMRRNAAIGSIFGLAGDLLTIAAGDTLPDTPLATEYGVAGALAFSQDFEREADYVAVYILALAGLPLEAAVDLVREFGLADPAAIGYASTHPTSAERAVRLRAAIDEVRARAAAGEPLRPRLQAPNR